MIKFDLIYTYGRHHPDDSNMIIENLIRHQKQTKKWRHHVTSSGPRLNIKTVLSTYGDFHVKDKTAVRTSYL